MKNNLKQMLVLNFASLCISSSGVLGKLVTIPPALTIFLRCLAALPFIFILSRVMGASLKVDFRQHRQYFVLSGMFMGGHWVTYFISIQLSNVAIAMITLFTFPVITTLIEPLFFKTKISGVNLFTSLLVMFGIYWMVPAFDLGNTTTIGIMWGLLSAVLYSIRNLMNKRYVNVYPGTSIMFYQMIVAAVLLLPTVLIYPLGGSIDNLYYILTLGLITTAIGHTLFVRSLKHFSTSTASIINGMQPVYGILLAALFIGEQPGFKTIIGGVCILITVGIQSFVEYKKEPLTT